MKCSYNFVVLQDAHRQLLPHLHDAPQQLFPLPELVDVEFGPHIKDDEAYHHFYTFVDSAGSAYLIRKSHATGFGQATVSLDRLRGLYIGYGTQQSQRMQPNTTAESNFHFLKIEKP